MSRRSQSSAVLGAPEALEPRAPRWPLEEALAEAYKLDPEGTLAAPQGDVDSRGSRLEGLTGADRHGLAGRLRQEIRGHRQAVACLLFVSAIAAGQPAEPIPAECDAKELVRRYVAATGPAAWRQLVPPLVPTALDLEAKAAEFDRRRGAHGL